MYENLLSKLKNAAKPRKQSMALENGFKTPEEFKTYLQTQIDNNVPSEGSVVDAKPTIHIIDIIDCSGSMQGGKHTEALIGINEGIKNLKKDTNAIFTYTICDFGSKHDIKISNFKTALPDKEVKFEVRGCTALYRAICQVFDKFSGTKEKVLMNIYTDGGDNESSMSEQTQAAKLIKELGEDNFTVTFIGTTTDTKHIQRVLNINESNTLSYDGSAEGLKKSLEFNSTSRSIYSAKVAAGEDVKTGFYKTIVDKK